MVVSWSPTTGPAGLAEWQTRRTQNALSERTCGFDPHSRYDRREERRTPKGAALFTFATRISRRVRRSPTREPRR